MTIDLQKSGKEEVLIVPLWNWNDGSDKKNPIVNTF